MFPRTQHQIPFDSLLPPPLAEESPSHARQGRREGQLWLVEKQAGQEGVAERPGQPRGGGGSTGQEENTDLFSLVGLFPEFDF